MNNKRNKKILTIFLICISFIIVVFSIISLRTYSVGNEEINNWVDVDDVETNSTGSVSSAQILEKPQSLDTYELRELETISSSNGQHGYINCNNNECKLIKIPETRTQSYSNNLCWAYGASNALEVTTLNKNNDTNYNASTDASRFSPTHMGYALGKEFTNNDNNEYGYMNLLDGGFALDSILYLTNGIGPILAPNESGYFNVNNYKPGLTIPNRSNIINNQNYPIDYKVNEIQMISGIKKTDLGYDYDNYPSKPLVTDRINTIKKYLTEGFGVTIESRSYTTSDSPKCDCSNSRNTYCTAGSHNNGDNTCFYHVTLIVGWDDNYSKNNFVSGQEPPANGAWIVRNSLRTSDLFYVSYYDYRSLTNDTLVITDLIKYNDNNKYDNLYQYNPSGCQTWKYQNYNGEQSYICKDFIRIDTSKIVNVYTRENTEYKERLKEVSFFVNKPTTVSVYFKERTNVNTELFTEENKIYTKSVLAKGYYTVPISNTKINDTTFTIGLSSNVSGEVFAFQGVSNPNMTKEEVGIQSGVSYYLIGNSWVDTANTDDATNFIKTYTITTDETIDDSDPQEVTYKVRYYKERLIDNEYDEVVADIENKTGHVGDVVEIIPGKNYPGFTKPENQTITLSENTPDVKFEYKRNKYQVILRKGNGISSVSVSPSKIEYKYGEQVTIDATVSDGYVWSNWTNTNTSEVITTSKEYTINSIPDHNIDYTANAVLVGPSQEPTISLNEITMTLYANGTQSEQHGELIATTENSTSIIQWTSSNTEVATVNSNGIVTAKGKGETTITAKINGTSISATCKVTVKVKVERIYFEEENVTVKENMSVTLSPIIEPDNANDKIITWTSSKENVATVENGVVRGISAGEAIITARTSNGKIATCHVTVERNEEPIIHVETITVSPKNKTMYVGSAYKLKATIEPDNATDKNVIWSSNNNKIASVDTHGNVIALKAGIAIITAKSADGKKKAQSVIVVLAKQSSSSSSSSSLSSSSSSSSSKQSSNKPKPTGPTIKISEHSISLLKGKEHTLKATVSGINESILWSSSDISVATVENGKVVAVGEGTAKIIAKINGTTISDKCEVKVINEEEVGIRFASDELIVYLDKTKNIEIVTSPTDLKIDKKKYTIEDEEIISIEEDIIKGLKLGSTNLKIKVNDKYEAEVLVKVIPEPMTLQIEGYNINFNENTYSYEIEIQKEKELVIASNKEIEIEGNENLKNKSIIKITNKETEKVYEIKIKKKNKMTFVFLGIITVLASICTYVFIKKKKD